jgi:hypothetical protein
VCAFMLSRAENCLSSGALVAGIFKMKLNVLMLLLVLRQSVTK